MGIHMSSLRVALGMTLAFTLGLGLASCNDDHDGDDRTVSSVARMEISQSTTETSEPIQINDLSLSDADAGDTSLPDAI